MIAWKKLAMGTLVPTLMVTTGTLIWFGATRRTIRAIDIIEVFQGPQERAYALQTAQGTWTENVVSTNTTYTWTQLAGGPTWIDANGATQHYYEISATNITVTTNGQWVGRTFSATPIALGSVFRSAATNGARYIWGGYSNYVVSGISAAFDGTYSFTSRTRGVVHMGNDSINGAQVYTVLDKYTKVGSPSYQLYDMGPLEGLPQSVDVDPSDDYLVASCGLVSSGSSYIYYTRRGRSARHGPWHGSGPLGLFPPTGTVVVTESDLITNNLRSASVMDEQALTNAIGWNSNYRIRDASDDCLEACAPYYIDHTLTNAAGEYESITNFTDLAYVWTNLLDRAGASVTGFNTNSVLSTNAVGDRYQVTYMLQWNTFSGSWVSATNATTTRVGTPTYSFAWQPPHPSDSNKYDTAVQYGATWALAKAAAEAATPTWSRGAASPSRRASGSKPGGYNAHRHAVSAVYVVSNLRTDLTHTARVYIEGSSPDEFDTSGDAVGNGYAALNQTWSSLSSSSVTSSVMGGTNWAAWCAEPAAGESNTRGYSVDDEEVLLNWNHDTACNYLQYSAASKLSWNDAKLKCGYNLTSATVVDGQAPKWGTWGAMSVSGSETTYQANAVILASSLMRSGLYTNLTHRPAYYVKAEPLANPNGGDEEFYSTEGFVDGEFTYYTDGFATTAGSITSGVIGTVTFPTGAWCSEPTNSTGEAKGYQVTDAKIVMDWSFEYCTNSLF